MSKDYIIRIQPKYLFQCSMTKVPKSLLTEVPFWLRSPSNWGRFLTDVHFWLRSTPNWVPLAPQTKVAIILVSQSKKTKILKRVMPRTDCYKNFYCILLGSLDTVHLWMSGIWIKKIFFEIKCHSIIRPYWDELS